LTSRSLAQQIRVALYDLLAWMGRVGVSLIIDPFHDDVSWVVSLSPSSQDQPGVTFPLA
jgi:hypothetical protein